MAMSERLLDLLDRALIFADGVVGGIGDHQRRDATPCPDYTVNGLAAHLVGGLLWLGKLPVGGSTDPLAASDPNLAGAALLPPFRLAAAAVRRNWTAATLATTYATPMGAISGAGLASYTVVEIVVHSWDLAVATGQAIRPTEALAEAVLGLASEFDEATLRAPGMMAPAVDLPVEAPAMDRLVAFLGRDPYSLIQPSH
jgi:uncharacterized protein (TIGR03086 family)